MTVPTLHAAERRFIAALARGTRRAVTTVTQRVLEGAEVVRGRLVSLDLSGALGALRTLPTFAHLVRLENLDVSGNALTRLDAGDLARLATLDCRDNRLVAIDLRGCAGLESLDLRNNRLTSLDLSPLIVVDEVRVTGNPLREVQASELLVRALASVRALGRKLRVRTNTAAELHRFADRYNWDDADVLQDLGWVASNPACDRATALLIYWRAQPDYVYRLRRPDADEQRTRAFLSAIEQRFADGFYRSATIRYDPGADIGRGFLDPKVPATMRVKALPQRRRQRAVNR